MNFITKHPAIQSPEDQVSEILRLLRPLVRHNDGMMKNVTHDDVTPFMLRLLTCLHMEGPKTVPALARTLETGRQYVQRTVNDLLGLNLIDRVVNPAHQRSWIIALTDDGLSRVEAISRREHDTLASLADGVSENELQACLDVLHHVFHGFNNLDRGQPSAQPKKRPRKKPEQKQESLEIHEAPVKEDVESVISEPDEEESLAAFNWNGRSGLRI